MEQAIVCKTPEQISAFRLLSVKMQLRLESKGLRSSGGALRPRLAAEFGLKPRASYEQYIAAIDARLAAIKEGM